MYLPVMIKDIYHCLHQGYLSWKMTTEVYIKLQTASFGFISTTKTVASCHRTQSCSGDGAPYAVHSPNKLNHMDHFQNKMRFSKSRNFPIFHFPQGKALS